MSSPDAEALTPVATTTRREMVVDAIRRAVLSGELEPGAKVREAPLAATLGVSRPTVREALYQLVHEGLLLQTPYEGITVARLTAQDLREVTDVHVSLETMAALQLAKDPDGPAMARLREALERHLAAIDAGDLVAVDATHVELHRTVWEGAGNSMLMRVWPLVEARIHRAMTLEQATRSDPARDAQVHRRFVEVIAAGDAAAIVEEVRWHIVVSADELVALMEQASTEG